MRLRVAGILLRFLRIVMCMRLGPSLRLCGGNVVGQRHDFLRTVRLPFFRV